VLPQAGAQAVGAGVAAADDDYALAFGMDGSGRIDDVVLAAAILLGRKSMAKWIHFRSRPRIFRSRGCSEPPHRARF
jgi:hypothetical protein